MSTTFSASALRLCRLCAQSLGWPPSVFWNATPAELAGALTPAADAAAGLSRQDLHTLLERDNDIRSD